MVTIEKIGIAIKKLRDDRDIDQATCQFIETAACMEWKRRELRNQKADYNIDVFGVPFRVNGATKELIRAERR